MGPLASVAVVGLRRLQCCAVTAEAEVGTGVSTTVILSTRRLLISSAFGDAEAGFRRKRRKGRRAGGWRWRCEGGGGEGGREEGSCLVLSDVR